MGRGRLRPIHLFSPRRVRITLRSRDLPFLVPASGNATSRFDPFTPLLSGLRFIFLGLVTTRLHIIISRALGFAFGLHRSTLVVQFGDQSPIEKVQAGCRTRRNRRVKIIPVLDVMAGRVVRAVAGRREQYHPWRSPLCDSDEPVIVGPALVQQARSDTLYIADLDAIQGRTNQFTHYKMITCQVASWIDAGVRHPNDATAVLDAGATHVIVGSETIASPEAFSEVLAYVGADRVIFSLDLMGGRPRCSDAWRRIGDSAAIIREVVRQGLQRLIVLELSRVGVGAGTGTVELCQWLREAYPGLAVIAGGGIRDRRDVSELEQAGVSAVLVATALHEGRLP